MKTYYTAALDSSGDELTHRREHDSAKAARAWMKEHKTAPGYWDQQAERDGFHKDVVAIALFADDEKIDETETNFPAPFPIVLIGDPTHKTQQAAAISRILRRA